MPRRFSKVKRTPALIALVLAGCGSGSGASPDAAFVPTSAVDYCEGIAPFFCDFYLRCGRMDVQTASECKTAFLTSCNLVYEPRYIGLEAAGLLELDADGIEACRQHLESVACDQQILELSGPCSTMWRGTQPQGAACGFDVETFVCSPGTECVLGLDLCGDCRPVVAVGDACTPGTDTCESTAFCDAGFCKARVVNGGACAPEDRCMIGSSCTNAICTGPVFVAHGEMCDQGHRCPYLTACIGGTCQSTAALDQPCANDGVCEQGFCDAGTCRAPRADGESCDRPAACSSGLCDSGLCQPRPSTCIAP